MPAGGEVDPLQPRPYLELASETLSFRFLLLLLAVTSIQGVRLAWWAYHAAPSPPARAPAGRHSARARLVAHSTRGLARTAVWLTCAEGASGLKSAMFTIENSPRRGR